MPAPRLLLPDNETGRLFRATDWSATPLGPLQKWPTSLLTAVGICLNSRFPMFVWWGPELVNIYNDAYIPVLGKRHPAGFARSAPTIWGEIWPVIGPQAEAVMQRGEASWNERVLLVMERHGYTEDTWFTWSYSPIPDDRGGIGGLFCACTEDTPRVLVERERDRLLHEVELERRRLAEAFAQAPTFLAVLRGPQHVFEFVNERYYQLIGRRDLIGRTVREVLPEVESQGFFEVLDRVYATGEPFVGSAVRILLQRTPGRPLEEAFVDFVYQPMRSADGSVSGILANGVDVTERTVAQRTLRESEARFRQLADAMPQIVFTAQPDGTVDYFNRQWYDYTGLPPGAIGPDAWRHAHTPEGLERALAAWYHAVRTGEQYECEYPLRRHDGEYRWHLGRAVPVRDEHGRILRWYGTNTDIHDRKQFEQSLQAARAEAERASRMKDEFLATLSHELRTPLNAILGWAQILRLRGGLPSELTQGVEVIERNARVQGRIIEDLLDMSAIVSGKVRLELKRTDLAEVVRAAVAAVAPSADAKHLALEARLAPERGALVRADASRLQQVLWNLLTNAVKFTPAGGRIEVALEEAVGGFRVRVADTGEGIDPQFLPHMFDRFRQADASKGRRHGGLGLGLAIVKQLTELHGGSVEAHSEGRGRGAAFTVTFPRLEASAAAAPAVPAPARDGAEVAGLRVLVVDDDEDARDLVRRLLEDCDASVTTAASAEEAARLVQRRRFDVLVSDIGMPGEDGHSLLRRVRALGPDKGGDVPAIALSAYARTEDRVQAVRAGFQLHLAKPVEPAELIAMVASVARRA
ncbi:MAG TPA: ATP-binding protein [Burkholderiales bacterium]|nr:ATP-binding protein [Burkholderiales bacterium]